MTENEFGITDLMAGAFQLHELYTSYIRAGFTESQAMQLVCTTLEGAMKGDK